MFRTSCGGSGGADGRGVFRLRMRFAARNGCCAQDDSTKLIGMTVLGLAGRRARTGVSTLHYLGGRSRCQASRLGSWIPPRRCFGRRARQVGVSRMGKMK